MGKTAHVSKHHALKIYTELKFTFLYKMRVNDGLNVTSDLPFVCDLLVPIGQVDWSLAVACMLQQIEKLYPC